MKILENIKRNWFLICIIIVIILAKAAPEIGAKGGPIKPEITVKYVAVLAIFFMSGISQKTEDLGQALLNVQLHAFIQGFTLLFVPLFVQIVVLVLELFSMDRWIIKGILAVSCMPPPVSSAIILTKAAGGNEAAAIFNSAFGSLLGIFLTPTLLLFMLGTEATVPISSSVYEMLLTVMAPLISGQIVQRRNREKIRRMRIPFGTISSTILLFIIYTTFCDTFINPDIDIDIQSLTTLILIVIFLQLSLLFLTFYSTSVLRIGRFLPDDIVAILFCSTHKSLTLGIPILRIMFHGDKHLSHLCVPLLIYHPVQIVMGGLLLPVIRKWLTTARHRVYRLANPV